MSFEDIEEARWKRAAKETAKTSGKRGPGRRRKSPISAAGTKASRAARGEAEDKALGRGVQGASRW